MGRANATRDGRARPRLLDLFCGAGGAGVGYARAGFEVVGVDLNPQPNYPFEFHQADALTYPLDGFDLIWASPPCQDFSAYGRRPGRVAKRGNLIPAMRERLQASGAQYIIENVSGAIDQLKRRVMLCGSSFGLDIRRHRLFECSFSVWPKPCDHGWQKPRFACAGNRTNLRSTVEVGCGRNPLAVQQAAMGIDWMPRETLSQAIPPAYSEYLGHAAIKAIEAQ